MHINYYNSNFLLSESLLSHDQKILSIQALEVFIKCPQNFTPIENIYHLAPDDTAVTDHITNAVINGDIINSAGVLSYREEDSRNPIHYNMR